MSIDPSNHFGQAVELAQSAFPGAAIGEVEDANRGNGVFSRVVRVGLVDNSKPVPDSVVVKLAVDGPNRAAAIASGAYRREELAYDEILPRSPVSSPSCWLTASEEDGSVSFVLEDLGHNRFVDQRIGLTRADALSAVDALREFHQRWRGDPELARMPVRHSTVSGFSRQSLQNGLEAVRVRWAPLLADWVPEVYARLLRAADEVVARFELADRPTLCHGDPRASNMAFAPSGSVILFDWQQLAVQMAEADLAWLATTSLTVDNRRSWDAELMSRASCTIDRYRKALALPSLAVLLLAQREVDQADQPMVVDSLTRIAAAARDYELSKTSP